MSEESEPANLGELTWSMFEAPAAGFTPAGAAASFTRYYARDVIWDSVGLGASFLGLAERVAEERGG